jgi:prophage regulatory protein
MIPQKYFNLRIQRRPEVLNIYGYSRTTLDSRIKDGLAPPSISLGGARAVGWLEHENNSIIAAMAAGQTQVEIKALVASFVEARKDMMEVFK